MLSVVVTILKSLIVMSCPLCLLQNNAHLLDKVTANGQIPVIMDLVQEIRQELMDCRQNYSDIREETDDVQTKLLQVTSQHLL